MEEEKHHLEHKEHTHHEKKEHIKIKKSSLWMIISGILAVLLVVSYYTNGFK